MPRLKPQHCQYITDRAARHLHWLDRLIRRLGAHQVPPEDPLMRATIEARNAMHGLRVTSMYEAMPPGTVGQA
jgi:hypothetical protein